MRNHRLLPFVAMLFMAASLLLTGCPAKESAPADATKSALSPDPNCGTCGGDGTVVVNVKERCTTCEGTGQVLGHNCNTCHGSGEMSVATEKPCPKCSKGK